MLSINALFSFSFLRFDTFIASVSIVVVSFMPD